MDKKKLEKKITKLKATLKKSGTDDLKKRALRKLLKRAQRKTTALKVKTAMVSAKAEKKPEKEEAA